MGPLPSAGSDPIHLKAHSRPKPTTAEGVPPDSTASSTANYSAASAKVRNTRIDEIRPSDAPVGCDFQFKRLLAAETNRDIAFANGNRPGEP